MQLITIEQPKLNTITLNEEALAERQELLDKGEQFQSCETAEDQGRLIRHARSMKALLKDTEAFRKSTKAPFQAAGKLIDEKVKEYCEPLKAGCARLQVLASEFQLKEDARVEAERQAQEKERLRALAEAQKAEAEAKKAAEALRTEDAGLSEAEQAVIAEMEASKKVDAYEQTVRQAQPAAARATGQIIQNRLCFEVEDKAVAYADHPECFELVPKKSVIRDLLDAGIKIKGVKSWTEKVTGIRA
jgi:hypothetical protein